jgi:predicted transcriptional regulator
MRVLLSIKPTYSHKIFSGQKKFEFRRQRPKSTVETVIVYESSPSRHIVGGFSVKKIHSGSPEHIWERCKDSSGIGKEEYLSYCNGRNVVHAFEIEKTFRFDQPMDPFKFLSNFKPPQSFFYIDGSAIEKFIDHHGLLSQETTYSNNDLCPCTRPLSFFP